MTQDDARRAIKEAVGQAILALDEAVLAAAAADGAWSLQVNVGAAVVECIDRAPAQADTDPAPPPPADDDEPSRGDLVIHEAERATS